MRFSFKMALPLGAMALGLLCAPSHASTFYEAFLSGAGENPANASPGIGFGTIELNNTEDQITVNESWTGLLANATASHIHIGAPGTNGPVNFPFAGVTATKEGSIAQQTFAINATQLAALKGGNTYFNVHTTLFGGGEIRGQVAAVPEPGSLALLATALPAGGLLLRRRKSA